MKTENWREEYDYDGIFGKGLARVSKDGKWGFVNKQGKVVIPIKYDLVYNIGNFRKFGFSEGFADVEKDGLCGVIDKQGIEKWD